MLSSVLLLKLHLMKLLLNLDYFISLMPEAKIEGRFKGDIVGIAALNKAQQGDLAFLANPKYAHLVGATQASLVLVPEDFKGFPKENQTFLYVKNPSYELAKICKRIEEKLFESPRPGIHPTAVIEEGAQVDSSAYIGPFTLIKKGAIVHEGVVVCSHGFIGNHAVIGKGSLLMPNVTVTEHCELGSYVRLNPGVVIGGEGYGYSTLPSGEHKREPQVGKVVLEEDVEIGANSTVDRARFGETRIGKGTKIDNLVMIGHNVRIGEHCLIVAQTGISGSVVIGNNVVIAGQVGISGHITIGDRAKISARSVIVKNLPSDSYVKGDPALPYMVSQRIEALKKRLPEFFHRISQLEKSIAFSPSIK